MAKDVHKIKTEAHVVEEVEDVVVGRSRLINLLRILTRS